MLKVWELGFRVDNLAMGLEGGLDVLVFPVVILHVPARSQRVSNTDFPEKEV